MQARFFSRRLFFIAAQAAVLASAIPHASLAADAPRPTIVLVHGALADASSWSRVIPRLQADGYRVVAAANPLRSLKGDADYLAGLVRAIDAPVVLVGHSYGGAVISSAAAQAGNVKALVYVAAFAPEAGESAFDLVGKFPGSELGAALAPPLALDDGSHELHVEQQKFRAPFAADLPPRQAAVLAAAQRPVTDVALKEAAPAAAWKSLPSWFVYGGADKSIPPAAHAYMAQRAHARETIVVPKASHLLMLSQPGYVVRAVEDAAAAVR